MWGDAGRHDARSRPSRGTTIARGRRAAAHGASTRSPMKKETYEPKRNAAGPRPVQARARRRLEDELLRVADGRHALPPLGVPRHERSARPQRAGGAVRTGRDRSCGGGAAGSVAAELACGLAEGVLMSREGGRERGREREREEEREERERERERANERTREAGSVGLAVRARRRAASRARGASSRTRPGSPMKKETRGWKRNTCDRHEPPPRL